MRQRWEILAYWSRVSYGMLLQIRSIQITLVEHQCEKKQNHPLIQLLGAIWHLISFYIYIYIIYIYYIYIYYTTLVLNVPGQWEILRWGGLAAGLLHVRDIPAKLRRLLPKKGKFPVWRPKFCRPRPLAEDNPILAGLLSPFQATLHQMPLPQHVLFFHQSSF